MDYDIIDNFGVLCHNVWYRLGKPGKQPKSKYSNRFTLRFTHKEGANYDNE